MGAVGGVMIPGMSGLMDCAGEAPGDRIPGREMRLTSARGSTERFMSTKRGWLLPGSHQPSCHLSSTAPRNGCLAKEMGMCSVLALPASGLPGTHPSLVY